VLDEDDYDLLQEANVTGFHRPPKAVRSVSCNKICIACKTGLGFGILDFKILEIRHSSWLLQDV